MLGQMGQMYFSMTEYPKYDFYEVFSHKMLCYRRATAVAFILNLLFTHRCFIRLW